MKKTMADKYLDDYYDEPIISGKNGKSGKKSSERPKYSKKHVRIYQGILEKNVVSRKSKKN